jgi:uncharacterized protein
MTIREFVQLSFVVAVLQVAGCGDTSVEVVPEVAEAPRELQWEELMPPDYDPFQGLPDIDIGDLADSDPRALRFMEMLRDAWNDAPVVEALDGQRVRLPGFVVPLEYDDKQVSEFLLVPYFGACIHTPPPPSNQIVHVTTGGFGPSPEQLWDPVWVSGTMFTSHISSELGDAGYRMDALTIEPYVMEQYNN